MSIIKWRLYEVTADTNLQENSFRRKLREHGISNGYTVLVDNSRDGNTDALRFALVANHESELDHDYQKVTHFFEETTKGAKFKILKPNVYNPILTKLDCNS